MEDYLLSGVMPTDSSYPCIFKVVPSLTGSTALHITGMLLCPETKIISLRDLRLLRAFIKLKYEHFGTIRGECSFKSLYSTYFLYGT